MLKMEESKMYDRNKGVQSIIDANERGDPDEEYPHGGVFNVETGRITHSVQTHIEFGGYWYYVTSYFYPVYKNGRYVGYYSGRDFKKVV